MSHWFETGRNAAGAAGAGAWGRAGRSRWPARRAPRAAPTPSVFSPSPMPPLQAQHPRCVRPLGGRRAPNVRHFYCPRRAPRARPTATADAAGFHVSRMKAAAPNQWRLAWPSTCGPPQTATNCARRPGSERFFFTCTRPSARLRGGWVAAWGGGRRRGAFLGGTLTTTTAARGPRPASTDSPGPESGRGVRRSAGRDIGASGRGAVCRDRGRRRPGEPRRGRRARPRAARDPRRRRRRTLDVVSVKAVKGEALIGASAAPAYMANVCAAPCARRRGVGAALLGRRPGHRHF